MVNTIRFFLVITTLLSFYCIGSVGLSILPFLGVSGNAENINNVILNLSYSYFAGFVFYVFISYLPEKIQKQKIQPVIRVKYGEVKNQITAYINSFNVFQQSKTILNTITVNQISQLFNGNNLNKISYFSSLTGVKQSNAEYINSRKDALHQYLEGILFYKEYLSSEQIVLIEQIKDHTFLQLFKVPLIYTDKTFLNNCAEQFSSIIQLVRQFEQTL